MSESMGKVYKQLEEAMQATDEYYKRRGIFQGRFGFGDKPAVVVVGFAYGWTDDTYAGGSRRLDNPVENTKALIEAARSRPVRDKKKLKQWLSSRINMLNRSALRPSSV